MTINDTLAAEITAEGAADEAAKWLREFAAALSEGSAFSLEPLFAEDATWRDYLAFSWDFSNRIGRDQLIPRLIELAKEVSPDDFVLLPNQPPVLTEGMTGTEIWAFFDFTTEDRLTRGFVRLKPSAGGLVASTLQTQAEGLQGHPEATHHNRPTGKQHGVVMARTRWAEDRREEAAFENSEPAVVILGAGQQGLAIAARLKAFGVSTLVLERHPRVGDVWRRRYASLALHTPLAMDHQPYMPFPPTWTSHTPKDKLADFQESYANLMDLNVMTGVNFTGASYDEAAQLWTICIEKSDGSLREFRPRHFVIATGTNGPPKIPSVKGLDTFSGQWAHSGEYQDGRDWAGKNVLVVGSGVSGHEISQDLYEHGASVTMLQRSANYVVRFETINKYVFGLFNEDQTLPTELVDMVAYAIPNLVADELNKQLVQLSKQDDQELLDKLEARGFKLEWGPDGTGVIGLHMSGRDSYQIDIGASGLIADGHINLRSGAELAEVRGNTAVFTDGSEMEDVDLILFATGYELFWDHVRPMLGDAAKKVDKVYGRAADGEYANCWRRSAQPGLWFAVGFVGMARYFSKFTALLIKAIEEGVAPVDPEKG